MLSQETIVERHTPTQQSDAHITAFHSLANLCDFYISHLAKANFIPKDLRISRHQMVLIAKEIHRQAHTLVAIDTLFMVERQPGRHRIVNRLLPGSRDIAWIMQVLFKELHLLESEILSLESGM